MKNHKSTLNVSTLEVFEDTVRILTREFIEYMYPDYKEDHPEFYWIGDDVTGTVEICDYYWSLSTIYEVLKEQYPVDKVFAWYDYSLYHSSKKELDNAYYLNMGNFMLLYDGQEVKEFAKEWHKKIDSQRKYANSKEGKEETKKLMEALVEKFKIDTGIS